MAILNTVSFPMSILFKNKKRLTNGKPELCIHHYQASPKASYDDGEYDRLRTCCKNSSQKHYRQKSMCFYKMALISEK